MPSQLVWLPQGDVIGMTRSLIAGSDSKSDLPTGREDTNMKDIYYNAMIITDDGLFNPRRPGQRRHEQLLPLRAILVIPLPVTDLVELLPCLR